MIKKVLLGLALSASIAMADQTIADSKQNNLKKIEHWTQSANQGDSGAQFNLGLMYETGQGGVTQDYKKAIEFYSQSANQGNSDAQYNLGLMYVKGKCVAKDYKKAMELWTQSANQGDSGAQYSLGLMYYNGNGVTKDYKKAMELWTQSANQGNSNAKDFIKYIESTNTREEGDTFYNNKDYSNAEKLYLSCAMKDTKDIKGDVNCNRRLAMLYIEVFEFNQSFFENMLSTLNQKKKNPFKNLKGYSYENLIKHFKISLSDKNFQTPELYYQLGYIYYNGISLLGQVMNEPDYKQAVKYFKLSMNAPKTEEDMFYISNSANIMGFIYKNGLGVLQDFSEAEKYFKLAIQDKNSIAKCNLGELYLQQNKIKEAKQLIKEGYQDGEEYCHELWNTNGLGQ